MEIAIPPYFKAKNIGSAINPVQLAEELADMNKDRLPITEITTNSSFESEIPGQTKENYSVFALEFTEKMNLPVANVGKINFNSIELICHYITEDLALILLTKNAKKDDLQVLYKAISSNVPNAKIESKGLPQYASDKEVIDLDDFITISFIGEQKIIKLSIDVSLDYYAKNASDDVILAYDEQNPNALKKVFEHYLNLFGEAKVRLYIVSKSFDEVLRMDEKLFRERTSLEGYQRQ